MGAFVTSSYIGGVSLVYNGQEVAYPVKLPLFSRSPINWANDYTTLQEYINILNLRNSLQSLTKGDFNGYPHADIISFKRSLNGQDVWVLVNTRNTSVSYTPPAIFLNTQWTEAFSGGGVQINSSLILQPYQYLVLRR